MLVTISRSNKYRNTGFPFSRNAGFSLFELIVFIICVAIIYSAAANRFAEFPGEAERANFLAVSSQIQAAVNLELMMAMLASNREVIARYESANPMDFLLETPSNYLGAFYLPDASGLPRRSWYFDQSTNELVYLINDADDVFVMQQGVQIPTNELRFKIEIEYRYRDSVTGLPVEVPESTEITEVTDATKDQIDTTIRRTLAGMLLRPVTPYVWGSAPTFIEDYSAYQAQG
ncbi:MAG: type II secretion system protein [Pseudohongiellaceae bacterium]